MNFKQIKVLLLTIIIIFLPKEVFALQTTASITVDGLTITYQTSIDTIIEKFGEPKLKTNSAFGGYAYTFYTDSNYDNYLYIETNAGGVICSYASLDSSYTTSGKYSYGDTYNTADTSPGGYVMFDTNNSNVVIGGLHYTSVGVKAKATFVANYESNPTKYLKGLSQQGVLMYNALMYLMGGTTELVWDEDMFYVNEQFKEIANESIRRYFLDVYGYGKTSVVFTGVFADSSIEVESSSNFLLNPMQFAFRGVRSTLNTDFGERNIAIFDYDYDNKILSAIVVSSDVFEPDDEVSLTSSEISKLGSGRAYYESAIDNFSSAGSSIYTTTPVTTSASGLVAGVLKDSVQQGILDYVNAIRVAGGHSALALSDDVATVAQYKATLLSYRYSELGLAYSHYPWNSGCDEISEEYLTLAGKYTSYVENLYWSSSSSTTTSKIMSAVNALLDEGSESSPDFGHRYNMLNKRKYVGFGMSPYIFSNEFSGTASNDEFLIAWPSEGITFMETLVTQKFRWTATFTDNYDIISGSTTVDVTCLNTGDTWSFTDEEGSYTSSVTRIYKLYPSSNRIVFADPEIVPQAGYVYKITINNLTDTSTGETTSYTYRTVFKYADVNSESTSISSLSIDSSNLKEKETGVYYVAIGEEEKLNAIVDEDATDYKVTWSSSDDSVKVTQNGTVIASEELDHDVIITLTADSSGTSTSIKVSPYVKTDTVFFSEESLSITKGESTNLYITNTEDFGSVSSSDVVWQAINPTTPDIVYDIDDSNITDYLQITVDEDNPFSITIKAVDAISSSINEFEIIATVTGDDDTYSGSFKVEVVVPLTDLEISYASTKYQYSMTITSTGKKTEIDYDEFYEATGTNEVTFTTKYSPSNATTVTSQTSATWKVTSDAEGKNEDSSVMTYKSSSGLDGTFTINSVGVAYVWTTIEDITSCMEVTITSSAELESVKIYSSTESSSSSSKIIKTTTFSTTDQLLTSFTPSIYNGSSVEYSSSDESIATVDDNGLVTFYKEGTVKITGSLSEYDLSSVYTYTVRLMSDDFDFDTTEKTIVLGKTLTNAATTTPTAGSHVTYSSSDTSIATVTSSGVVTGIGVGTVTITATLPSAYSTTGSKIVKEYTLNVVSYPVTSISTSSYVKVYLEESSPKLSVTINPSNYTDSVTTTWSSSDSSILTIDNTGQITAKKAGTATVTVTVIASNLLQTNIFTKNITVFVKSVNDANYLLGDMNDNGIIDVSDIILLIKVYFGNLSITDYYQEVGDMNVNGTIDISDIILLIKAYFNS